MQQDAKGVPTSEFLQESNRGIQVEVKRGSGVREGKLREKGRKERHRPKATI